MAWVNRRITRGEQGDERWLRPMKMKGGLAVAVGSDLFEIAEPDLSRVDAKLLFRFAEQQIVSAFDVGGGERLAVVPFDALPQFERQLGAVLAPRPAGREVRHDRLHAVLWLVLR